MDLFDAISSRLDRYQSPKKAVLMQVMAGMAYALGQGFGADASGQLVQTNNPFLLPAPDGQEPAAYAWGMPVATFATPEQGVDAFLSSPVLALYTDGQEVYTDTYALARSMMTHGYIRDVGEDFNAFAARYIATMSMLGSGFALYRGFPSESGSVDFAPSETFASEFAQLPSSPALTELLKVAGLRMWYLFALSNGYGALRDPVTGELRMTGNYAMIPCAPQPSNPGECFLGYYAPPLVYGDVKLSIDDAIVMNAKALGIESKIAEGDAEAWKQLGAQMSGRSVEEMALLMTVASFALSAMGETPTIDLPSSQKMALVLYSNGEILQEFGWLKSNDQEAMTRDLFGLLYYSGIQSFFGDANVGRYNYGRLMKDGVFLEYASEAEGLRAMLDDLKARVDVIAAIRKGDIDQMIVSMARSSPDAGTFDEKVGIIFQGAKNAFDDVSASSNGQVTGFSAPNMERVKQLSQMAPGQIDVKTTTPVAPPPDRPWWHYGLGGVVVAGAGYVAYKLWLRWQKEGGSLCSWSII